MKKLLSLLLSLILIVSSVGTVFAVEDTDIPTEVSVMQQLGFIEGDENGELNLEKPITRAEFSAMLVRVLGVNGLGYSTQIFADVPLTYWGADYIAACYNLGIINGYGDGNFGPDDIVTYEQAVKMVVCALGYEPMAASKGSYPTGYLAVANQIKITENTKDNSRKDIITLVYNALTTPKMGQTAYGSETKYEPLDDENNYTTILTERDIYIATGIVENVNAVDGTFDLAITEDSEDFSFKVGTKTFEIGKSNIVDYINESVVVYVNKINRNKYTVVAIEPTFANEILVINASDLKVTNVGSKSKWEYYASINATKTTKIDVDTNAKVYVNGNEFNADDDYFAEIADKDAVIKFIENDDTKGFDTIDITIYEHAIAEEIYPSKGRIECLDGSKISYDIDDEDIIVKICDEDGYAMDISDIDSGDVLAIVVKEINDDGMPIAASKFTEEMVIYNLGNNYIEGVINKATSNEEDNIIYIDNKPYEYSNNLVSEKDFFKNNKVNLGTEGVFYLGIDGKIIGFDGVAGASGNYAFILQGAKENSSWEDRYQVKLLLANGDIKTYYVDEDVEYNCDIDKWTKDGDVTDRVVEYKLNSKNVIISLESVSDNKPVNNAEFKERTDKVGSYALASDVIIFNVDVTDANDATVIGIDSLVDEGSYSGYVLAKEDDGYEIFVVTNGVAKFDAKAPLYIVDNVVKSTYGEDKDACYEVTYYCGEDKGVAIFTNDAEKYSDNSLTYETLKKGSIFVAITAADGLVGKYMVLANVDGNGYDMTNFEDRFNATYSDNDVSYVYGKLTSIDKKYINVEGYTEDIVIDSSAAQYYYNAEGSKPKLEVGDWNGTNIDEENNNYVFIKLYEDEVIDIIAFSFEN